MAQCLEELLTGLFTKIFQWEQGYRPGFQLLTRVIDDKQGAGGAALVVSNELQF